MARTDNQRLIDLVKQRRFTGQFSDVARANGYEYVTAPQRGYKVELARDNRGDKSRDAESVLLIQKARQFLEEPPAQALVEVKKVDANIGHGLFATTDLDSNTPIAEYTGQHVSLRVAQEREKEYAIKNMAPRIIRFTKYGSAFDGNVWPDGTPCSSMQNLGAIINHSRTDMKRNCKAMICNSDKGDIRMVFYTCTKVPCGDELRWDYNDRRKGLEDWMYQ